MLTRPGPLPSGSGWSFELNWDGFRAIVSTAGIPDVHYGEDAHFVSGNRGVSEWTLAGTTTEDERLEFRGCDLWTFRDGQVVRKDSYWKIVE